MQSTTERFSHIKKIGTHEKWTQDIYHRLLICSWPRFFLIYLVLFLVFNLFFASCYWINPNSVSGSENSFWHCFVFSVQTFTTVGYGVFHPGTDYSHFLVITELILSVFVTAVLTGLIFAKFSRPSARIIFSNNILINTFEGKRTLMLRMGNLRGNQIAEAQVRMVMLKNFKTAEGQSIRRQIDLKLTRDVSLFFALTWSIMHVIDESSPLYNVKESDFKAENIEFAISVIGYDSTFSQTIHANVIYSPEDIAFDRYFADVFNIKDNTVISINYDKFHALK